MASNRFFYNGDGVEDMGRYRLGGYHPVLLGDIVPPRSAQLRHEPRYRIIHKLGHGGFSTTWLARDILGNLGYVAIKIGVSNFTGRTNEIEILRWLLEVSRSSDNIGAEHFIRMFDKFLIEGPNGTHGCIVTEVVGSMNDLQAFPTFRDCSKFLSRQCLTGLSYLHEKGVTHGDFHAGNLGIALPQLKEYSEESILEFFSNPELTVVVARDPLDRTEHLPPYLVRPISLVAFLESKDNLEPKEGIFTLKILDFGNSYREGDREPPANTPLDIRAPEHTFCALSFGTICSDWDKPSIDVWAAACTLYELNVGFSILEGVSDVNDMIYYNLQMAGPLPPSWQKYWDLEAFCKETGKPQNIDPDEFWTNFRRNRPERIENIDVAREVDIYVLINLLRTMLKMDPQERPQLQEAIKHPWFVRDESDIADISDMPDS